MSTRLPSFSNRRQLRTRLLGAASLCLICALPPIVFAAPGDLEAIGVNSAGVPATGYSGIADVSEDARYVAFFARDSGIVAGDTNGKVDLFVRDRQSSVSKRVTVSASGQQANDDTFAARITPDGRYVVFTTKASNLVPNDNNGGPGGSFYQGSDVFVHDRQTGVTERVSIAPNGQQPNELSLNGSISDDGRYVAFYAAGTNLGLTAPPDNSPSGVFVRDRQAGTTKLVSVNSAGVPANFGGGECDFSGDGRYVTFTSFATNLAPNDTNDKQDVFVHDRQTGVTERVNFMSNGNQFATHTWNPVISADGRYVAFVEDNSFIWVRDRWTGTTEPVSVSSTGALPNRPSYRPSISADGRFVAFESHAYNLVPGDTNGQMDVFRRDRVARVTEIVSRTYNNNPASRESWPGYISPDGKFVGFTSWAGLVPGDTDNDFDAYLYEMGGGGLTQYAFTLKPTALAFGPQPLLTSRALTFWLRNTGTRVLPIEAVFLRGHDPGQFAVASGCGSSLNIGASCPIKVTFKPKSLGDKVARVHVIVSDLIPDGFREIRTREVSGTGVTSTP